MQLHAHLTYDGQCEEAFRYYEKHLGGKVEAMMRAEGSPMESNVPAEQRKKIIHARLKVGDTILMGNDNFMGPYQKPQGFTVTLRVETPIEAERIFAALEDGGAVKMAMNETFFAKKFGSLVDRFGTPWIVICEKAM
ncbi:MAG: VOC family protein [Alphaproteobacteria bacterium]|nr:VOC family protein [Alphaproteobacteria bacterium]MDE2113068.1 VOC family protein [Alphaproteobacteria bacterium]MDE2493765.1 VOC family protein [Alphaproteobacteria bacterium]